MPVRDPENGKYCMKMITHEASAVYFALKGENGIQYKTLEALDKYYDLCHTMHTVEEQTESWEEILVALNTSQGEVTLFPMTLDYERFQNFAFVDMIILGRVFALAAMRKKDVIHDVLGDFFNLERKFWVSLLLSVLTFCLVMESIEICLSGQQIKTHKSLLVSLIGNFILYLTSYLFDQGFQKNHHFLSHRIASVLLWFGMYLISNYWSAAIRTDLVVSASKAEVNTLEDLANNPQYHILTEPYEEFLNYLKHSTLPEAKNVWQRISSRNDTILDGSGYCMKPEDSDKVMEGTSIALVDEFLIGECGQVTCDLNPNVRTHKSKFPMFESNMIRILVSKTVPLFVRERLNRGGKNLFEKGIFDFWFKQAYGKTPTCFREDISDNLQEDNAFTLKGCWKLFYIWLGGMGLGMCIFLAEISLRNVLKL